MAEASPEKVTWQVNSRQNEAGRWEPYAVVKIEGPEGVDFEPIWGPDGLDFATREEADAAAEQVAKEWLRKYYRKRAMKPKGPGL
jgi:hypothetical protein